MDTTRPLNHVSLCYGYGGIDIGLHQILGRKIRTILISEIEAFAIENALAKMEGVMTSTPKTGPIYGQPIPSTPLPIGSGMRQALPSRSDLMGVMGYRSGQRVVAAYEVIAHTLSEAQKDTARLDWMEDNKVSVTDWDSYWYIRSSFKAGKDYSKHEFRSLRAAIDAAMRGEPSCS